MRYLTNAFSLSMLPAVPCSLLRVVPLSVEAAAAEARDATSAVGHADTAALFSEALGFPVAANRATLALSAGDVVIVGQYVGPRLAEGTTQLPPGARIDWRRVSFEV